MGPQAANRQVVLIFLDISVDTKFMDEPADDQTSPVTFAVNRRNGRRGVVACRWRAFVEPASTAAASGDGSTNPADDGGDVDAREGVLHFVTNDSVQKFSLRVKNGRRFVIRGVFFHTKEHGKHHQQSETAVACSKHVKICRKFLTALTVCLSFSQTHLNIINISRLLCTSVLRFLICVDFFSPALAVFLKVAHVVLVESNSSVDCGHSQVLPDDLPEDNELLRVQLVEILPGYQGRIDQTRNEARVVIPANDRPYGDISLGNDSYLAFEINDGDSFSRLTVKRRYVYPISLSIDSIVFVFYRTYIPEIC